MTIRQSFAAGTALVAVAVAASPALAAQEMSYEQQAYEFAQPLPAGEPVVQQRTVFTSNPVVQAVAEPVNYATQFPVTPQTYSREVEIEAPAAYHGDGDSADYAPAYAAHTQPVPQSRPHYSAPQVQQTYPAPAPQYYPPQQAAHAAPHTMPHSVPHSTPYSTPQPVHQGGVHGGPALPPAPSFDRSGWLDNCEDELRRRKQRGGTAGGLLGAIAGGVIGNRVADGERLGGTLIGAGIGGIAGAAIGSAIGSIVKGNPYLSECKAYLENWERGGYQQQGYQNQGYGYQGYAYGQQAYTYVPATAYVTTYAIERPVVREYITEEWVDVPVEHVEYETVTVHQPAPQPVRYIKQRPVKRVKYIKGQ